MLWVITNFSVTLKFLNGPLQKLRSFNGSIAGYILWKMLKFIKKKLCSFHKTLFFQLSVLYISLLVSFRSKTK